MVSGASSGIGKEILLLLDKLIRAGKEQADEIWAIARSTDKLEALAAQVKTPVIPVTLDLSDRGDLLKLKEKLEQEQPRIRVLANCAGFGYFDHTENIDTDLLLNMVDLNCTSYVAMINYALPCMPEGSRILNIASCAGFQPIPYINCYAATKAFVLNYTRALNVELKYKNIHCLAVTPFWTRTAFFDRAINADKKPVVINYAAMYDAKAVAKKAVKDLYSKKEISCCGFVNNGQRILVRLLPKKLVMKVWMGQQKLDGTPGIRP
ncbi:MAG: SDR family NAD(P)-dependent oxidoreductase [Lachnospiraceae bacterium]|nr:SDR family NAD(P)-dependent oxidoreductase [Lachnospiraceae bacterium]